MAGGRKEPSGPILERIAELGRLCGDAGVPWALGGGHAANRYRSEARATVDIDLFVDAPPEVRDRIEAELVERGWDVRRFPSDDSIRTARRGDHERLDLLYSETDLEREVIDRAQSNVESDVPVIDGEALIVLKLIAGRSRDEDDVLSMLLAHPDWSDSDWILAKAKEWDQEEPWDRLRASADAKRQEAGVDSAESDPDESPPKNGLPDPP